MRCRTCEYPLWNLTARQCPECGAPFLPSEYEFKIGFVQFRCPHCGQSYYGTDEKGHLEPKEFDCVSCGRHVSMDGMVLLPSEGVEDDQTRLREPVPWLARRKIGFLKGWFKTLFSGMGAPAKLARALPRESPKGQAWWFAVLTLIVCTLAASVPFLSLFLVSGGMSMSNLASGTGVTVLVATGLQLAWLVVWGLSVHAMLRVMGVAHATLARTFECVCYTCGPCAIVVIPCLGLYMFWIGDLWWAIVAAVMISTGYGIRGWKAGLAAFTLPVLAACGIVGLIMFAVFGAYGPGRTYASFGTAGPAQAATALAGSHAMTVGAGSVHAAELVATDELTETELIDAGSASTPDSVKVGTMTLRQFLALDREERMAAAAEASAALPPGVIAHRIGDVVFTYHGLDESNPSHGGLWSFIVWRDPDVNSSPPQSVTVGFVNGMTLSFDTTQLPSMLQSQNTVRGSLGLPPIPDPATVTQDAPR